MKQLITNTNTLRYKLNDLLILGILVIFPLGQLSRLWWLGFEKGIYLHDLLIIAILLLQPVQLIKSVKHYKYLVFFTLWAIAGLAIASVNYAFADLLAGGLYLARIVAYLAFGCWLMDYKSPFLGKRWTSYSILTAALFILAGWLQYFLFPSLESLFSLGWDRHSYRLVGTLLDPNFTGLILVLMAIKSLEVFDKGKIGKWFIFVTGTILFTYSRMAYLLWGVVTISYIYFSKKTKWLLFIPAFGLLFFLLPRVTGESTKLERTSTITARMENITNAAALAWNVQPLGVGLNLLSTIQPNHTTDKGSLVSHSVNAVDNSLLFLLITTGFVGTLLFCLFWKEFFLQVHNDNSVKKWGYLELLVIFLAGMVIHAWFYPWVILWLLFSWKERSNREYTNQTQIYKY